VSDTEQSVVARSKSGKHGEIHASCGGVKCLRTARAVDLHGSVKNPERSNPRKGAGYKASSEEKSENGVVHQVSKTEQSESGARL
jgi:hypothetical protein